MLQKKCEVGRSGVIVIVNVVNWSQRMISIPQSQERWSTGGVLGVGWGCPHIVGFNSRHTNQNLAELEILSCCDG